MGCGAKIRLLARERIGRPLDARDGISLRRVRAAERRLGFPLPAMLRAFYRLAGRNGALCRAHHRFRRPEELSVDEGYLVFLEENQEVVSWGIRLAEVGVENPIVWQRNNTPPAAWYSERKRFTTFLRSMYRWYARSLR